MSSWDDAPARTRMFARVMGPFIAIVAVSVAVRQSDMATLLTQFTDSAVWPWVTGAFILLGGIAVVAFHQSWRSPAGVLVSLLGWALVIRGVVLLAFPAGFASLAVWMMGWPGTVATMYIVMAVIGFYLSVVGWMPRRPEADDAANDASADLPRAA